MSYNKVHAAETCFKNALKTCSVYQPLINALNKIIKRI